MKALGLAGRFRTIDGVILAAVALLSLKAIGLFALSEAEPGSDGLPRFAKALAYARSNYVPLDPTTTGSVSEKPKDAPAPPPVDVLPPTAAVSPAERAIRERLGDRREELQQRQRDLEAREKLLEEVERKIDARQEDLRASEERAKGPGPQAAAEGEAAALKGLVTMYETMKPKEAARVFERLPQDVLVPVVRLIAPRKMAEIMAALSPEAAEKLTVALARRVRTPDEERPGPGALPAGELQAIDPPGRPATPRAR